MPENLLSQIVLPGSSTVYDLKDAWAREKIDALSKSTQWLGITTTEGISDGADWTTGNPKSIKPVSINGSNITPDNGSIVQTHYTGEGSREYILSVTKTGDTITAATWQEFGDLSSLGSLAFKNSASGSVSVPTSASFSGTQATISVSGTTAGSISGLAFSGKKYTVSGSATIPSTYSASTTVGTTSTNVTCSDNTSGNYQPKGTVSTPTISVKTAGTTTSINNPTSKTVVTDMAVGSPTGSSELVYYEVNNEVLTFKKLSKTTGDSITTSAVTVKTGDAAYQSSQPSFTGTKASLKYDKANASATTSVSVASTESATVAIAFTETTGSTFDFQPAGTVSGSFTGAAMTSTGTYTPAGSVSLTNGSKTVTVG